MKKLTKLSLAAVFAVSAFVGCNSSDYTPAEDLSSSVAVYSFKLSKDDSVLTNLDTVFFSIDLVNGRIFNADSLPFGTKTDKLVPVINVVSGASAATLTWKDSSGKDTTSNYITNSTDTVDFSNGPVTLKLTSLSGLAQKDYSIEVNVHKHKTDSMVWSQAALRKLPTSFSTPKAQRTVQTSSAIYTLTSDGTAFCMASTDTPASDRWDLKTVALPAGADINSFTGADNSLYILASGHLYRSTDGGASWSDTGETWQHIYCAYGDGAVGARHDSDGWKSVSYPSKATTTLPEGMPVSGTSQTSAYKFPMSQKHQVLFVGGKKADGTMSADTWAYDGSTWANISVKPLPKGLGDMTVVPFFIFKTNNIFVVTKESVLLAFGGNDGTEPNDSVYISNDYGMNWSKGSSLMQLPDYVPAMSSAQAYVYESTLSSRSGYGWESFETAYRIPAGAIYYGYPTLSRATTAVDSWQSPYIYVFGGTATDGSLYDTLWRATINRFTFKPII